MKKHFHYIVEGSGPVVMLSHALGCDLGMWEELAAILRDKYTVVRYDHRGHGSSLASYCSFSIEDLADDASQIIEKIGLGPVHFVGVSMGGMTAQALAANYPEIVKSITIAHATSYYEEKNKVSWHDRIETVRKYGMISIADSALSRWLSKDYMDINPDRVSKLKATLLAISPDSYIHACAAVSNIDFRISNSKISCPTLVIAGIKDQATPYEDSLAISKQIANSKLEVINSAHIGCVEQPFEFASKLISHIESIPH